MDDIKKNINLISNLEENLISKLLGMTGKAASKTLPKADDATTGTASVLKPTPRGPSAEQLAQNREFLQRQAQQRLEREMGDPSSVMQGIVQTSKPRIV